LGGFTLNVLDKFIKDSSGVSSVLGEILITGVFVLSLGSLFVFVNSIDTPVDSTRISVEEWVDAPSNTIYLRHVGGEPIDTKDLKINVQINGTNYVYSSSNISENLGGKGFWELADVIQINTSQEWGIGIANEENMDVKLIDTNSKEVLPKYRISFSPESPASSIDFDIENDTVVPQEDFISSFTVIGAAFQGSYLGHSKVIYYDRMVTSQLKVGSKTFDPWGDYNLPVTSNLNGRTTNSWSLPATYPAGTPVTVIGQAWDRKSSSHRLSPTYNLDYTLDSSWSKENCLEVSSENHPDNLKVLRNGDSVPNISGAMDQDSIADFVAGYVEDGKIVLDENEVIFLFELGTTELHSSAADFQDLVILMTIDPAPAR